MKIKILLLMILSLFLVSCGNKIEQLQKQNLSDDEVVQNLEHINNAMDKAMNGGTEEDVMGELGKLKKVENNTNFDDLPDWLYDLGFKKPDGLSVDKNNSEISSKSVSLTYNIKDIDEAIQKAEKLAKIMNISESEASPRKQLESMLKMITDKAQQEEMKKNMKGAMFTNCSGNDCANEEYSKMISVFKDDKGNGILQIVIIKNQKK